MIMRRSDDDVFKRAKMDLPLSLRELSVASGYCYSIVKRWKKNGLPLLDGRITLKRALTWRESIEPPVTIKQMVENQVLASEPHPSIAGHRLLQDADKPRAPKSKHGSPSASPQPQERQHEKASSQK